MPILVLLTILAFPAAAAESANLFLRGRVPAVYQVTVNSSGEISATSNGPTLVLPRVTIHESEDSWKVVTVTHP